MSDFIAGVAAILDAEQAQRVIVFGSGTGGYLAQCLVWRYPERVERLILAHTGIRQYVDAGPVRALACLISALPEPLVHWGMGQLWRHELSVPQTTHAFWLGLMHDNSHVAAQPDQYPPLRLVRLLPRSAQVTHLRSQAHNSFRVRDWVGEMVQIASTSPSHRRTLMVVVFTWAQTQRLP